MISNENKKLSNINNKTPNNTQFEPKSEETSRNTIYKKYRSSNIFETINSNNSEKRPYGENTLIHVIINYKFLNFILEKLY